MTDCNLPEDLMLCILTRLPVKSIHRFKSVCKTWCEAFSSPEFRKMHRAQFSQNPENQSIVIHGRNGFLEHITLLKIDSDEKTKPTKLDFPFPPISSSAEFVGCCNGLFCTVDLAKPMVSPPRKEMIVLWNPALNKMSMLPPHPGLGVEYRGTVSFGFGYNEEADDFKVVRIVASLEEKKPGGVEVYSANSDSWTTLELGFKFEMLQIVNPVIVNGSLYWVAMVDEIEVSVCFDVREMVFKIVPLPDIVYKEVHDFQLLDLKGNLGALVCNKKKVERVLSFDIWVYDDVGKTGWTKNRSFEMIEQRDLWECLKNGKILVGVCFGFGEETNVFVFDTETGDVLKILIDEVRTWGFDIYGYTESLALAHIN